MKFLAILFLLSGCGSFHEKPLPESEAMEVAVNIVWVESVSDIPVGASRERDIAGYTVWVDTKEVRRCLIYAIKPYNEDDFNRLITLGHELLHCTDGHYHGRVRDKNGSEMFREIIDRP